MQKTDIARKSGLFMDLSEDTSSGVCDNASGLAAVSRAETIHTRATVRALIGHLHPLPAGSDHCTVVTAGTTKCIRHPYLA